MSNSEALIDRRKFLVGATAALAMTAVPASAEHKHHHNHEHKHQHGKHKNLVGAAEECVATGKACLNHCLILLGDGDTSMAECAKTVSEMIPVCEAMAALAMADSKHLKTMAETCLAVCQDCEDACKEHQDHHMECKDCYEACKTNNAAIEAFLKTA